jgi:hypothetical protein
MFRDQYTFEINEEIELSQIPLKPRFRSSAKLDEQLVAHDNQSFELIKIINEPDDDYATEALPMFEIKFNDGFSTSAFFDEIFIDEQCPTESSIKPVR